MFRNRSSFIPTISNNFNCDSIHRFRPQEQCNLPDISLIDAKIQTVKQFKDRNQTKVIREHEDYKRLSLHNGEISSGNNHKIFEKLNAFEQNVNDKTEKYSSTSKNYFQQNISNHQNYKSIGDYRNIHSFFPQVKRTPISAVKSNNVSPKRIISKVDQSRYSLEGHHQHSQNQPTENSTIFERVEEQQDDGKHRRLSTQYYYPHQNHNKYRKNQSNYTPLKQDNKDIYDSKTTTNKKQSKKINFDYKTIKVNQNLNGNQQQADSSGKKSLKAAIKARMNMLTSKDLNGFNQSKFGLKKLSNISVPHITHKQKENYQQKEDKMAKLNHTNLNQNNKTIYNESSNETKKINKHQYNHVAIKKQLSEIGVREICDSFQIYQDDSEIMCTSSSNNKDGQILVDESVILPVSVQLESQLNQMMVGTTDTNMFIGFSFAKQPAIPQQFILELQSVSPYWNFLRQTLNKYNRQQVNKQYCIREIVQVFILKRQHDDKKGQDQKKKINDPFLMLHNKYTDYWNLLACIYVLYFQSNQQHINYKSANLNQRTNNQYLTEGRQLYKIIQSDYSSDSDEILKLTPTTVDSSSNNVNTCNLNDIFKQLFKFGEGNIDQNNIIENFMNMLLKTLLNNTLLFYNLEDNDFMNRQILKHPLFTSKINNINDI